MAATVLIVFAALAVAVVFSAALQPRISGSRYDDAGRAGPVGAGPFVFGA